MALNGERSTFANLFHSLGYTLEELGPLLPGKGGAAGAPELAGDAPGAAEMPAPVPPRGLQSEEVDEEPLLDEVGTVVAVAAGSWLLAKLLRPKSVSWPRAILAGAVGTALYDLTQLVERRLLNGAAEGTDVFDEAPSDTLVRYGSGLSTAVAYAAILHPRLPGPPLARGLLFGVVDAATLPSGGAFALVKRLAPGVRLPLEWAGAQLAGTGSAAAHVAYGLGLGLVYRSPR